MRRTQGGYLSNLPACVARGIQIISTGEKSYTVFLEVPKSWGFLAFRNYRYLAARFLTNALGTYLGVFA